MTSRPLHPGQTYIVTHAGQSLTIIARNSMAALMIGFRHFFGESN